ncbi:MAG: alpha-galactosidase [Alphaproteobacteria bacterium]|nr:alpha-galactosidase [Alphaproteobacteria bacterium]
MRWLVPVLVVAAAGCPGEPVPDDVDPCDGPIVWAVEGDTLTADVVGCGGLALTARVVGDGQVTVDLGAHDADGALVLDPVLTARGDAQVRGLVLEGTWTLGGSPRLWRQGYQSWSWSGVVTLPDALSLPLDDDGLPAVGGDGDAFSLPQETAHTSWWGALLGSDAGGALLAHATSAAHDRVWMGFDAAQAWVVWGGRGETWTLADGATRALDGLRIAWGRDSQALAASWPAHTDVTPPAVVPPSGWASWYELWADVSEQDVRDNAAVLADAAPDAEVVQIDDGWSGPWGDWHPNARFPSGIDGLASDLDGDGFTPGLWMAPLYVDRSTSTFQDHDDWWVRDLDGVPLRFTNAGTGDYAVLDVTHPDAAAWLHGELTRLAGEGIRYFKLDFLYAGAEVGLRHDDVTGIEAYAQAMALFRDALPDAFLLACGAPLQPSAGTFDAYRSGADIAFELTADPDRAYARWQLRQTVARGFLHGRWWWNDADGLLVRRPLTDADVSGMVVSMIVSGGVWLLSDDLTQLDADAPDRLALAARADLRRFRGTTAVPRSPWAAVSGLDGSPLIESFQPDDTHPVVWDLSTGHVAAVNLMDAPVSVELPVGHELLADVDTAGGATVLAPGEGVVVLPDGVAPTWPELAPWRW